MSIYPCVAAQEIYMKIVKIGMNGPAVARHGLILRENEARGLQEAFAHGPGPI